MHGEAFEFLRNDALDARNYFEFTSPEPHPFERNQFGGLARWANQTRNDLLLRIVAEGLRQRQGVDMNSLVLSDDQRAAATNPVIRQLIPLIPRANFFNADGTPEFVGSAPAVADKRSLDGRCPAQHRGKRSRPGVLRKSTHPWGRADRARQQHSWVRQRATPVHEHSDDQSHASFWETLP